MAYHSLSFNSVEFSYPSSIYPVLKNMIFEVSPGWTGITGENGAGKTTLLLLAADLLRPSAGTIRRPDDILYCPQRTDTIPKGWEDLFFSGDNTAGRLMDILGLEADWPYRWDTLSHGERKRFQLAAALMRNPAMLAVDEPTNHLDRKAASLVQDALEEYTGVGLLVSHDRALLDRLCNNCLFLREGTVTLRPGGVSRGLAEEERELVEQRGLRKKLMDEGKRLAAEADRRRRIAESSRNRLSKQGLNPRDGDTRGKINLAKLSGKDAVGANQYKRMKNRSDKAVEALEQAANPHERKKGINLGGRQARADRLLSLEPGSIPLGEERKLSFPELYIRPGDRIALTGPNGSGKSTLIRQILSCIPEGISRLCLPQELSAEESQAVLEALFREEDKFRGEILARFSRLGSDPRLLFQSALPSPGEMRKLLIARGVFYEPAIVIMDEPTNHLDLVSVGLLEEALAEYPGALLLVSHDEVFLSRLTNREWTIDRREEDSIVRIVL
ncbi:MAG: ATP-binding cassette domain-containing protein [Spirochaetaceae bacterium]|jgi:ATPase subunit of ABC transporter with duplicated ATPase domains|nr:ATP-binding cassette domain-containing protein [Spirochaetaceae bacterium]